MPKKKKIPYLEGPELSKQFAQALRTRGPFMMFSDTALGEAKHNYLGVKQGVVLARYSGTNQLMWFEHQKKAGQDLRPENLTHEFFVYTPELGGGISVAEQAVSHRLEESMSARGRKMFERIFEDPRFGWTDGKDFGNQKYSGGVIVSARIRELPIGASSGLSDSLFECAYNGLALPTFRAANGSSEINHDWYEFKGGRESDFR